MAPRKSSPNSKPSTSKKAGPAKVGARPSTAPTGRPPVNRPPVKKAGKSIVNQKQTPWGLIITTAVIVVFAAGVVSYAVFHKSSTKSSGAFADSTISEPVNSTDPYSQPELPAAAAITGVTYTVEPNHEHVQGHLRYNASPPVGGNHSQYWADCTGTVYPKPIANENAVHMLEHGAVWITYKPGLAASQVAVLSKLVNGINRTAMSPYPDLKTNISLQSWGYQLFVDNASDPRIVQFITALRYNTKTTPEPGATCSQPTFKQHPSTFGNPLWVPAT
jgi:hypothetical protein